MHFHIQCISVRRMVYNYLYNIHNVHLLNNIRSNNNVTLVTSRGYYCCSLLHYQSFVSSETLSLKFSNFSRIINK